MLIGGGTFAYLHGASDSLANIFNSNTVTVDLRESTGQSYEVIPGATSTKDPTVIVNATVPAYVFVDVTDELYNDGNSLGKWTAADGWGVLKGNKDDSFVLYRTVEGSDSAQNIGVIANNAVSYSAALENKDMNWAAKALTFKAYAIQKDPFSSAEAAWEEIKGTATVVATEKTTAGKDTTLVAKIDGSEYTAVVPKESTLTVNGGNSVTLDGDDNETLKLEVVPTETSGSEFDGLTAAVGDGESKVCYNVSLYISEDNGTTYKEVTGSNNLIKVSLDLGAVDVVSFYHKGTKYETKVDSVDEVTEVGKFYVKQESDNTNVTFLTNSFSPFTTVVKFAGGLGTEDYPYLIETKGHMQAITNEYGNYHYYKVADGVETMDCEGWTPVYLDGSFDGNGIAFTNATTYLFRNVGHENEVDTITLKDFDITMNVSTSEMSGNTAVSRHIFNGGTTTFDNVDVHGTIMGNYHVASYYGYGPTNYDNVGCSYAVTFKDCQSDATLICIGGTCGGFIGHVYEGKDNAFTLTVDNSDYTGTIYTPTGDAGYYMGMNSTGNYTLNGEAVTSYQDSNNYKKIRPEKCIKFANINPTKSNEDSKYYVTAAEGAAKITATVTAQLTAYDSDNITPIANLSGITMTLGSETITTDLTGEVKVLDEVTSANIVNNANAYGYAINSGELTINVAQQGANYLSGTARLTVTQYDANGNVLCCGTTNLNTIPEPDVE